MCIWQCIPRMMIGQEAAELQWYVCPLYMHLCRSCVRDEETWNFFKADMTGGKGYQYIPVLNVIPYIGGHVPMLSPLYRQSLNLDLPSDADGRR